ncbi:MAG: hypothetical protein AB7F43_01715 [Bacteriovoracia bacterium]
MKLSMTLLLSLFLCLNGHAAGKSRTVKRTAKNVFEGVQAIGTWEGDCRSSSLLKLSYRPFYTFKGDAFTMTEEYYSNKDCHNPAIRIQYKGTYDIRSDVGDGAKEINLAYNGAYVEPLNDSGKNALEKSGYCGYKHWNVGQLRDITADTQQTLCPVSEIPYVEYNIFRVDNDRLYLGKSSLFSSLKQRSNRPSQLEIKRPFRKSEQTF